MRILAYYLQILVPLPILYWLAVSCPASFFVIGLLAYALIYRPFVDGYRLLYMGSIEKSSFVKLFIPFYSTKYFYDLYFKN
ncbi:hypothetical protein H7F33_14560 [Pedobacter sp. PAMC26386]|nr:hypothetical protein H7F33_14560 [Pedobacter sp. PAMC26386]